MFKLDNTLLEELGLAALPPEEKNRMLSHIYETLEMRVGMKLAEQMTNEQLDEFEAFIDKNDEAEGFLARIFQHEIDHTNGIVFIDHIKETPGAFFRLDEEGHLVELDYEKDITNNSLLWQ